MSFAKNFGKLKQWTNEKLGYAGRTEVSDHFKDLERIVDARRDAADTVFSVADKYADAHAQRKFIGLRGINTDYPIHALGTALAHFASLIHQHDADSRLAQVLNTVGTLQADLAHHQADFLDRLTSGFMAEWGHYVAEGKRYADLKRKLESRRLDYDAKLNKVQRAKKEKPELEEEVRAALFKYEETMKEVEGKMEYLLDFEDDGVNAMQLLVQSQIQFFEHSLAVLHQAQAALGGTSALTSAAPRPRPLAAADSTTPATSLPSSLAPSGTNTPSMGMLRENSRDSLSTVARPKPPSRSGSYHSNLSHHSAGGPGDNGGALGLSSASQPPMPAQQHHLARQATATPPPPAAAVSQQSTGYGYAAAAPVSQQSTGYAASTLATASSYAVTPAPAAGAAPATTGRRVRATFDFVAESDNELSLTVGDVVVVVHEVDAGWWIGEKHGRRGMFPSNYVESLPPESTPAAAAAAPTPTYAPTPAAHNPAPLAAASSRFGGSASNLHAASHSPSPTPAAATSVAVRAGGVPAMAVPVAAAPATATAAAVCGTCGCDEYKENVFKKGQCNNCFHAH